MLAVVETALEPTPGHLLRIEQVTHVLAAYRGYAACGRHAAGVEERLGVAGHRAGPLLGAAGRQGRGAGRAIEGLARGADRPERVPGDQVQSSGRGGTVAGAEGVVAHGEVLRVVPERRHGVPVVVVHDRVVRL